MRKTIRNSIDRRAVYKFQCTGPCNRVKFSYVYERAKAGVCLTCSKKQANEAQDSLFPEGNFTDDVILGQKIRNTELNNHLDSLANDMKPRRMFRIIDLKKEFNISDLPLVDRFISSEDGREFYIDENGIACEILENGDSTSDFEVPEELKDILIKERAK